MGHHLGTGTVPVRYRYGTTALTYYLHTILFHGDADLADQILCSNNGFEMV